MRDTAKRHQIGYVERQNSLPSGSASTTQSSVGPVVASTRAPSATTRANLKLGICGEHGGDPDSVKFCHEVGLDYVSCSPFRVPIARLAAAHAALGTGGPGSTA